MLSANDSICKSTISCLIDLAARLSRSSEIHYLPKVSLNTLTRRGDNIHVDRASLPLAERPIDPNSK
jgi:hypothetical protein